MLESILHHNFIRYIALTTAFALSTPVYAQTSASEDNATEQHAAPPTDYGGAYYIDPAKRKEKKKVVGVVADSPDRAPILCTTSEECMQEGMKMYQENNFELAANFFTQSYTLSPNKQKKSILLYDAGLAYEKAGDAGKAVHFYELYLSAVPDAKEKEEIMQVLPELKAESSRQLEEKMVSVTPIAAPSYLSPSQSHSRLDLTPQFQPREENPSYITPSNNEEKNKQNDIFGYVLLAVGVGAIGLTLIGYATTEKCPEGFRGINDDKCDKSITTKGWTVMGLGAVSMAFGLYMVTD